MGRSFRKKLIVRVAAVIGFSFLWKLTNPEAPNLKMYIFIYRPRANSVFLRQSAMDSLTADQTPSCELHKVFSTSLNAATTWFALNSNLCSSKPSTFCSSSTAKLFPSEYACVRLADLRGEDGFPARSKWFSAKGYAEDVFVATAFGILLGILRLKSLERCSFVRTRYFLSLVCFVNTNAFGLSVAQNISNSLEGSDEAKVKHLEAKEKVLEAEVAALKREILSLQWLLANSPPSTPSPPKCSRSAPKCDQSSPLPPTPKPSKKRTLAQLKLDQDLSPKTKKAKIRESTKNLVAKIRQICESEGETLGAVLGECSLWSGKENFAQDTVKSVFDLMVDNKGVIPAFSNLLSEDVWQKRIECMRVPDWVYLLFKLKTRISDLGWQDFLNLTKLGRTGKTSDESIVLSKNAIVALKREQFKVTRSLIGLQKLPPEVPGYEVNLPDVTSWIIREMRLHGPVPEEVVLNLKLDGRPFCGKDQVAFGVVPLNGAHQSFQSAKSVRPLAIANCREKREDLKRLVANLNKQKDTLKKNGIQVDGRQYRISFKVTLDYKGLLMIMTKVEEDSVLGGKGLMVEFCIFCLALRACDCDLGPNEVCLEHFLQTKANIGGFKGLRDDLTCILDEDLTSMCLCALHCEMRNTEQMLKSVGLIAHQIGSLQECNEKLSNFGPSNFKGDRLSVKLRQGQQTAAERNNISVASFSGNTERQILSAIEEIVEESLPVPKMTAHYKDPEAAKHCVLNKITFCETRQKYFREMLESGVFVRDHGTRLVEIQMKDSAVRKELESKLEFWKGKQLEIEDKFKDVHSAPEEITTCVKSTCKTRKAEKKKKKKKKQTNQEKECTDYANYNLSCYAASLSKEFVIKVCSEWKEIALVIRDAHFSEDEEHLIDIFDVKCKEWGFLLLEMFGRSLGTGDYGHLTIEHVPMLFRMHRSLQQLSNQGFEAAHKLQRQLYAKATSHDSSDKIASLEQIFTHLYTEKFLDMRYAFREAVNFVNSGKQKFYYRGCGWKPKEVDWRVDDKEWIRRIDKLFSDLFGPDFCQYESDEKKICIVSPGQFPLLNYNHDEWEESYVLSNASSGDKLKSSQVSPMCNARNDCDSSGSNISDQILNLAGKELDNDGNSSAWGERSSQDVNLINDGMDSDHDHDSSACGDKSSHILNLASNELDHDGDSSACSAKSGLVLNLVGDEMDSDHDSSALGHKSNQVHNPVSNELHSDGDSSACGDKSGQVVNLVSDEMVSDCDSSAPGDSGSNRDQARGLMPVRFHAHSNHSAESNKVALTLADFISGKLDGLSRKEQAAYQLPGVAFISTQDICITEREEKACNPLLAKQRPSERTVEVALNLLKGNSDSLVKIGSLGYYTIPSVKVFAKMCSLASEALQLKEELRWLSQTPQSPETEEIREVLERSRPNDVVLQQGHSIMDVKDYSTLACERYVNSFAIDTICLTILKESKEMDIVYLPCYSQTWAKQGTQFFKHKVSSYFETCPVDRARIIFFPVHFPRHKHWGLVCFDTTTSTVFFDDGQKIFPTRDILTVVRNMLSAFETVSNNSRFKFDKWNNGKLSLPFPRIGMPNQTTVGVGAGSCGVAVILSFKDIIRSGCPPSFQWEFSDMGHLRKELMSLSLQWRK